MEAIKSVDEFKKFMSQNREFIFENAIDVDNITLHDEWMQDSKWMKPIGKR